MLKNMPLVTVFICKVMYFIEKCKKKQKKMQKNRFLQYATAFYSIPDECPEDNIKKMKISHWKELAFNYF